MLKYLLPLFLILWVGTTRGLDVVWNAQNPGNQGEFGLRIRNIDLPEPGTTLGLGVTNEGLSARLEKALNFGPIGNALGYLDLQSDAHRYRLTGYGEGTAAQFALKGMASTGNTLAPKPTPYRPSWILDLETTGSFGWMMGRYRINRGLIVDVSTKVGTTSHVWMALTQTQPELGASIFFSDAPQAPRWGTELGFAIQPKEGLRLQTQVLVGWMDRLTYGIRETLYTYGALPFDSDLETTLTYNRWTEDTWSYATKVLTPLDTGSLELNLGVFPKRTTVGIVWTKNF